MARQKIIKKYAERFISILEKIIFTADAGNQIFFLLVTGNNNYKYIVLEMRYYDEHNTNSISYER